MKQIHQGLYRAEVLHHPGTVLFVLLASWCPLCRWLRPQLESLEKVFPKVAFLWGDWDNSPGLRQELDTDKPPILFVFHKGTQLFMREGPVTIEELEEVLKGAGHEPTKLPGGVVRALR